MKAFSLVPIQRSGEKAAALREFERLLLKARIRLTNPRCIAPDFFHRHRGRPAEALVNGIFSVWHHVSAPLAGVVFPSRAHVEHFTTQTIRPVL